MFQDKSSLVLFAADAGVAWLVLIMAIPFAIVLLVVRHKPVIRVEARKRYPILDVSDGVIRKVNRRAKRLFQFRIHDELSAYLDKQSAQKVLQAMTGHGNFCEQVVLKRGGSQLMVATHQQQKPGQFTLTLKDVDANDRNPAYQKLKAQLSTVNDSVVLTDLSLVIKDVNEQFSQITGYSTDEAVGSNISILSSGYHDHTFYEQMWQQLTNFGYWSGLVWNRNKAGQTYLEQLSISEITDRRGDVTHYLGLFSDVTGANLIKTETELMEAVTDINYLPGVKDLDVSFRTVIQQGESCDLVLIDIERYLLMVETIGEEQASRAMDLLSQRITQILPKEVYSHRIGKDRLVFMVPDSTINEVSHLVNLVVECFNRPVIFDHTEISLSANFGISSYPDDGGSMPKVLAAAGVAVTRARQFGANSVEKYDATRSEEVVRRAKYERSLLSAINQNELLLNYQPIFDKNGRLSKLESLLRWSSDEFGMVSPAIFIPIAEDSGLIKNIGYWVLEKALTDYLSWPMLKQEEIVIAINVSAIQLQDKKFPEQLKRLLETYQVPPSCVELEITESVFMEGDHLELSKCLLNEVKALGVRIALDDFGTGYSSLSYLKELVLDTLKIDRVFVQQLERESEVQVLESIISLAHRLGMKVVGEGVELEQQQDILQRLNCDYYQGFFYSKPKLLQELKQEYGNQ